MSEITIRIDETVSKFNMLSRGDFVVAGVSGGADSMLLLSYLLKKREELELRLLVANVEHGIRGAESEKDSAFVERFCREMGVEFRCLRINAPALAREAGEGIEEYSRKRRYEFFESFSPDKIATAHNLSDSVETVLFRLSRGTSINGCCGVPAVRGIVIRPLIELSSDEIRQECRNKGIPFVVDSTNSDNSYSRNYIRNVVIPDFEKLNPSFESAVKRFIESCSEDNEFLTEAAAKCFEECLADNALDIEALKKYHKAVIKRAISTLISQNGIIPDELHLNGVYELLFKRGKYQIKGSLFAISDLKRLRIENIRTRICFTVEQKTVCVDEFLNNFKTIEKEFDFYCDCDKIIGSVFVRSRQEGDRITPHKRNCSKSLKKLFNELKIPEDKRIYHPVIADIEGVIGVAGICADERVAIDEKTKNVLLLNIAEDKN